MGYYMGYKYIRFLLFLFSYMGLTLLEVSFNRVLLTCYMVYISAVFAYWVFYNSATVLYGVFLIDLLYVFRVI